MENLQLKISELEQKFSKLEEKIEREASKIKDTISATHKYSIFLSAYSGNDFVNALISLYGFLEKDIAYKEKYEKFIYKSGMRKTLDNIIDLMHKINLSQRNLYTLAIHNELIEKLELIETPTTEEKEKIEKIKKLSESFI